MGLKVYPLCRPNSNGVKRFHACDTYASMDGSTRCVRCCLHPDQCNCRHTGIDYDPGEDAICERRNCGCGELVCGRKLDRDGACLVTCIEDAITHIWDEPSA